MKNMGTDGNLSEGEFWKRLSGHGTNEGFVSVAKRYLEMQRQLSLLRYGSKPGDKDGQNRISALADERGRLVVESGHSQRRSRNDRRLRGDAAGTRKPRCRG